MKKVERRALLCVLFGLILLGGLCYFIYEDWHDGGEWAVYEGNRDVYADGERFRVLSEGRCDGNRRVYRLGLRSDGESYAVSVRSDGNRVA